MFMQHKSTLLSYCTNQENWHKNAIGVGTAAKFFC